MKRLFLSFFLVGVICSTPSSAQKFIELNKPGYESTDEFPDAETYQNTGIFDIDSLSQKQHDSDYVEFLHYCIKNLSKDSLPSCNGKFNCVLKRWCLFGHIVHIVINPEIDLPPSEKAYLQRRTQFIMDNWQSNPACSRREKFTDCGHLTGNI